MRHTPGPWFVDTRDSERHYIGEVGGDFWHAIARGEADANLIAAAPLMYEALALLAEEMDDPARETFYSGVILSKDARRAIRKALAAARGEGAE